MTKIVVIDSDAIFALYNPNDALHLQATKTFEQLIVQDYKLIYPTSVLFEIISLFQRVLRTPTIASKLVEMIKNDQLFVHIVDNNILKASVELFDPAGSKKNTLIDCSVVVTAKELHADGVFAYDGFYNKQGLRYAEDLLNLQTS